MKIDGICSKCGENEHPGKCRKSSINIPELAPIKNNLPAVWDLVIADMKERDWVGKQKYDTHLQPFNGRDALKDAYQEALDLTVYLRQAIYERDIQGGFWE